MSKFKDVLNPNCQVIVGDQVKIGEDVVLGPNCEKVIIGFGCFLGRDIYIDVQELEIGDYVTIHHGSIIHGIKTKIGHNCWFGHYSIIDSLAGETRIGNNVGVGAHSQLWSHMKFGDVLEGCRWNSAKNLVIEDDVWFVGHTVVGPIHAKRRSMLMTGSVAVKDMDENCIYAGSPAKNVTDKFGNQFTDRTVNEKKELFEKYLNQYESFGNDISFIQIVSEFNIDLYKKTQFCLQTRSYLPTYSLEEYKFIRFLLYDKAKFLPVKVLVRDDD